MLQREWLITSNVERLLQGVEFRKSQDRNRCKGVFRHGTDRPSHPGDWSYAPPPHDHAMNTSPTLAGRIALGQPLLVQ